jgi:hypothetical protein
MSIFKILITPEHRMENRGHEFMYGYEYEEKEEIEQPFAKEIRAYNVIPVYFFFCLCSDDVTVLMCRQKC